MSWRQRQLELDQLNRRISRRFGLVVGTLLGAFIGWIIALKSGHKDAFFTNELEVAGAAVCGLAGYFFGERFIDWLWRFFEHAPDVSSTIDLD